MKRKHIILALVAIALLVGAILGVIWLKRYLEIVPNLNKGSKWDNQLNKVEEDYTVNSTNYTSFYWRTEYDTVQNKEFLKKGSLMDSIGQSPKELIDILNMRPSECKIEYVDILNDTVVIRILNDEYLSERMGTTGAYCYLSETVYTLTENKSLNFVRIEMNPGSHAGPGVYDRTSFGDLIP